MSQSFEEQLISRMDLWTENFIDVSQGSIHDDFSFLESQISNHIGIAPNGSMDIGYLLASQNSDLADIKAFLSPYISLDQVFPSLPSCSTMNTTFNGETLDTSNPNASSSAILNTLPPERSLVKGDFVSDYIFSFQPSVDVILIGDGDYSYDDTIFGDDVLINIEDGIGGSNLLSAMGGNDFLFNLGLGMNFLSGGAGDDILFNIGGAANSAEATDEEIDNELRGYVGNDVLINYGTGTSLLAGEEDNDVLINLGDAATLEGGSGDDTLIVWDNPDATYHNDILDGGIGDDTLTGGGGADTFRLNGGLDTITDFNGPDGDQIEVDKSVFGDNVISTAYDANTVELSVVRQTVDIVYKHINLGFMSFKIPQGLQFNEVEQTIAVLDNPVGFDASSDIALI